MLEKSDIECVILAGSNCGTCAMLLSSSNICPACSRSAKCVKFSRACPQHLHGSDVVMLLTIRARCRTFLKCDDRSRGVSNFVLYALADVARQFAVRGSWEGCD